MTEPDLFEDLPPLSLKSLDTNKLKQLSKAEYFAEAGGPFLLNPPYTPGSPGSPGLDFCVFIVLWLGRHEEKVGSV